MALTMLAFSVAILLLAVMLEPIARPHALIILAVSLSVMTVAAVLGTGLAHIVAQRDARVDSPGPWVQATWLRRPGINICVASFLFSGTLAFVLMIWLVWSRLGAPIPEPWHGRIAVLLVVIAFWIGLPGVGYIASLLVRWWDLRFFGSTNMPDERGPR